MGEKPKTRLVPMPKEAHPELDLSPLLDSAGQSKYQSLIGCLQWCVTLGRFDIAFCVMTMSRFRGCPRAQHLVWLGHIFGYLRKYPDGAICFRTHIPDIGFLATLTGPILSMLMQLKRFLTMLSCLKANLCNNFFL